jgi:hypothetical protein
MSVTNINDMTAQVRANWSDMFVQELPESDLMISLVNRDYEGEIGPGGNEVKVTQYLDAEGEISTIGVDDDSFNPEKLSEIQIAIKADKIFSASFQFTTMAQLQSQLEASDSEIRSALLAGVRKKMNSFIYGLFDCTNNTGTVTDFNAAQVSALRKYAGQKKWKKDGNWYLMADPSYHSDMLNASTLTSNDYTPDSPVVGGQFGAKKFGFNIFEDNSDGLLSVISTLSGTDTEDVALAFHRDAVHFVMQAEADFEIASLTANKQRGYVIKVDVIGGGKAGHDHADLHHAVFNT